MKTMGKKRMLLAALLAVTLALTMCASAWAADIALRTTSYAVNSHYTNDRSDYKVEQPRYSYTYFDFDVYTTDPAMSFTIKNGNYDYRLLSASGDVVTVTDRDETFETIVYDSDTASDGTPYVRYGLLPQSYTGENPDEDEVHFVSENAGLAGKEFEVLFESGEIAAGTIPVWRTLSEQMASYVPHVEIVRDAAGKAIAVKCSIVDPDNPGVPLRKVAGEAPNITDFWGVRLYNDDSWIALVNTPNINYDADAATCTFVDGDELSATFYITNDFSLSGGPSSGVSMRYGEGRANYRWNFGEATATPDPDPTSPDIPAPTPDNTDSGGGGCNAGFAAGLLLLGACAFLKKR